MFHIKFDHIGFEGYEESLVTQDKKRDKIKRSVTEVEKSNRKVSDAYLIKSKQKSTELPHLSQIHSTIPRKNRWH